jgi:hypothetical protein
MGHGERLLKKLAKRWDVYHDFSRIPLGTLFVIRDSLFRNKDALQSEASFCAESWIAFGLVLGTVSSSVFISKQLHLSFLAPQHPIHVDRAMADENSHVVLHYHSSDLITHAQTGVAYT